MDNGTFPNSEFLFTVITFSRDPSEPVHIFSFSLAHTKLLDFLFSLIILLGVRGSVVRYEKASVP